MSKHVRLTNKTRRQDKNSKRRQFVEKKKKTFFFFDLRNKIVSPHFASAKPLGLPWNTARIISDTSVASESTNHEPVLEEQGSHP